MYEIFIPTPPSLKDFYQMLKKKIFYEILWFDTSWKLRTGQDFYVLHESQTILSDVQVVLHESQTILSDVQVLLHESQTNSIWCTGFVVIVTNCLCPWFSHKHLPRVSKLMFPGFVFPLYLNQISLWSEWNLKYSSGGRSCRIFAPGACHNMAKSGPVKMYSGIFILYTLYSSGYGFLFIIISIFVNDELHVVMRH